jgi:hypothetical protein
MNWSMKGSSSNSRKCCVYCYKSSCSRNDKKRLSPLTEFNIWVCYEVNRMSITISSMSRRLLSWLKFLVISSIFHETVRAVPYSKTVIASFHIVSHLPFTYCSRIWKYINEELIITRILLYSVVYLDQFWTPIVPFYATEDAFRMYTRCTMLGVLDQFWPPNVQCLGLFDHLWTPIVRVSPLKTLFGLVIPLLQSQSHITTVTHNYLLPCYAFTQL